MTGMSHAPATSGLSPRTRRNHCLTRRDLDAVRPISAHAEEPEPSKTINNTNKAYLRARGGTFRDARDIGAATGGARYGL